MLGVRFVVGGTTSHSCGNICAGCIAKVGDSGNTEEESTIINLAYVCWGKAVAAYNMVHDVGIAFALGGEHISFVELKRAVDM